MRRIFLSITFFFMILLVSAQNQHIKNVIVMIPDGTPTSLLSAARWYQSYLNPTQNSLFLDPYICGLVRTHSSDAPIGDSAPTTSCYMTGQPTQTGFISTYPVKTPNDLVTIDATRAYQPLATILEAAKQIQGKSTGLVFTCEFPHATPADCSAHTYKRSLYKMIAPQMVHNGLDVVIGGGVRYLTETQQQFLKDHGYNVYLNDLQAMRQCSKAPVWSLFDDTSMPYEIDRDTTQRPSLAEMTDKALSLLSQDKKGFFLMVEGSKVDWASHTNDVKTSLVEFLAFDKACQVALDFAKKNGETLVIIVPDHGCGGLNLGNYTFSSGYDKFTLNDFMKPLDDISISMEALAAKMKKVDTKEWASIVSQYYNIDLQDAEITFLQSAKDYSKSTLSFDERKDKPYLSKMLGQVINNKLHFGFTTYGHTGEDVFLAIYHPKGEELKGYSTNIQLHQYICQQMGLENALPKLTEEIYADHHQVFKDYEVQIDSVAPFDYQLTVKNKKNTLIAHSYNNFVTVNKKQVDLSSVIVYMPINNTFYLPKNLYQYLENKK